MPCARNISAFGLPQDRKDLFIGAYVAPSGATVPPSSGYLAVFIRNLPNHLAEKILLIQPLAFGGITPSLRNAIGFGKRPSAWSAFALASRNPSKECLG